MYKDLGGCRKVLRFLYDWLWSQESCCYDKLHGNEFHHQQLVAGEEKVLAWM